MDNMAFFQNVAKIHKSCHQRIEQKEVIDIFREVNDENTRFSEFSVG